MLGTDNDHGGEEHLSIIQTGPELRAGHHTDPDLLLPARLYRPLGDSEGHGAPRDGDPGPRLPHPGPGHLLMVSTSGEPQADRHGALVTSLASIVTGAA